MSNSVHIVAQTGFATGTSDLYDRARPTYQKFALDHIRTAVRTNGPWNVVEIGAGTGIFTRALLSDPQWKASVKALKAIEPSKGMRDVFISTVKDERISISDGTFQETGVEDGWADIIIIAQAFHWCPDFNKASLEFSRILKPEGVVALVWNLEDRDSAQWVARVRETIEEFEQNTPQFRHMYWRKAFDSNSYKEKFDPSEEKIWSYNVQITRDRVLDRVSTKSYIAVLPDDKKEEVLRKVANIVDEEEKIWVDEATGVFEYPYKTWVVIWKKQV